jgi:inositol-phosphate phosphatase/L-galactose 1-phosphate phosphatase/histidinol-phosphatase
MIKTELVEFAEYLADVSGDISRKYFRKEYNGELEKDDKSPVTIADMEIEKFIRDELEAKYPTHAISGEEYGELEGNSGYKWFIDPIDGTTAFISGKLTFTNLLALTYNGELILSLVNQPITNERWLAVAGENPTLNKQRVKTRTCESLNKAILNTTSPNLFTAEELAKFNIVSSKTKYQKYGGVFFGGDAYSYALLSSGYIDIVIEAGLKPHDFMPLVLLIKSAGGEITDWQGKELNENSQGQVIACGDRNLHKQIIKLLNEAFH